VAHRSCQAGCHGQSRGRCRTRRRALVAIRAGTAMRWLRRVAHRACACRGGGGGTGGPQEVERDRGEGEPGGVCGELPGRYLESRWL